MVADSEEAGSRKGFSDGAVDVVEGSNSVDSFFSRPRFGVRVGSGSIRVRDSEGAEVGVFAGAVSWVGAVSINFVGDDWDEVAWAFVAGDATLLL